MLFFKNGDEKSTISRDLQLVIQRHASNTHTHTHNSQHTKLRKNKYQRKQT